MERFARRWWGGELGATGDALGFLAAPVSWLWAGATGVRARVAGPARRIEGLRVISVGNLAVGGTGKTPMAAWVASTLHAAGVPAWVLVGEGGGDEALLHRAWNPNVPVLCGRDRVTSAARARAGGARVAVMDDGFQHRVLARDLDLVLLSADDPNPGPVLPRGPYRESPRALSRADALVVTRRTAGCARARELAASMGSALEARVTGCVHLAPGAWKTLDGTPADAPTGDVLTACGIARPESFRRAVQRQVGGHVELVAFPDHHPYTEPDLARLAERTGGRPLVVTEKDAAKLARWIGPGGEPPARVLVLTDRLVWDWGEEAVRAKVLTSVDTESRT